MKWFVFALLMLLSSTAFAQRVRQVETIGWEQVVAEGQLDKHGRRIGRWDYWYARDLKKPYATGVYVRGKRHGPWSWYYMHGLVLRKGQYIHGRKVGRWRWWYPNGRPQLTSRFDKKGRPHDALVCGHTRASCSGRVSIVVVTNTASGSFSMKMGRSSTSSHTNVARWLFNPKANPFRGSVR